jgi:DNA-directed RNA polymerase subunit K/omega
LSISPHWPILDPPPRRVLKIANRRTSLKGFSIHAVEMADEQPETAIGAAYEEIDDDMEEHLAEEEEAGNTDPYRVLYKYHPETIVDYAEAVAAAVPLQVVPPEPDGADPKHTSPPFLTVYERTKILGARANMIAEGARPFVDVPAHITAPLDIAKLELEQRRLPFIIKRPMPDGSFEYWRLSDLLII